jgi:hypothetical protein
VTDALAWVILGGMGLLIAVWLVLVLVGFCLLRERDSKGKG